MAEFTECLERILVRIMDKPAPIFTPKRAAEQTAKPPASSEGATRLLPSKKAGTLEP